MAWRQRQTIVVYSWHCQQSTQGNVLSASLLRHGNDGTILAKNLPKEHKMA